jgi:riboflavin kinase/FMN adenylyltransferase
MKVFQSFSGAVIPSNTALTIGNFDGVHLGHQALFKRLKQAASHSAAITFSNHPSTILNKSSITYLTTLPHRLSLLEKLDLDFLFLIPFSEALAKKTAAIFLKEVREAVPFSHLILGYDAVIGHDRQNNLYPLAIELAVHLEYLPPVRFGSKAISSSEIRKSILAGELEKAGELLGRPYSIFATVQPGDGKGRTLGFHTANLPVEELALPPLGVYAVHANINNKLQLGVANLGHAPTLHKNRPPCLEVHLLDTETNLYNKEIEVFFLKFLRPERRFPTTCDLKEQIKQDIAITRSLFNRPHA